MCKLPNCAASVLLVLAGSTCFSAQAATFCVNSQATFQAALTTSQTNGESNTIQVVAGNFNLTSGLFYSSNSAFSLILRGGYAAACATPDAGRTVLNGQSSVRPLFIFASNANVAVSGFDFVSGISTNNRGGGLFVSAVDVSVSVSRFFDNRADDFGGALFVSSSGLLRVRGNVLVGNSGAVDGGAELNCNGAAAYVTSNTIVGNSSDASTSSGGLGITGGTHYSISNNILWNNNANGAPDFSANSGHERLNNDIGTTMGFPPDASSSGNVSIDPGLAPCSGSPCIAYVLKRSSALVDAGVNAAPGGLLAQDIIGTTRIVGALVDIGAYEVDDLFENGFE